MRGKILPSAGRGMANEGARGRTDVCVGGQKGEGDRRGEREQGEREDWGAGGKRTREQGGWRTASCRESFKSPVERRLLRHLMVANGHDRQMREVEDALLGH